MRTMLIGMAFLGASLAVWGGAGCGKKEASCDAVFEHVKRLTPVELQDLVEAQKDAAIANCEKLTVEQRRCVLDATEVGQVAACRKK